jgi:hypothetical protein
MLALLILQKQPRTFSKLCFSPQKFAYRSLYNFLYLQLGPFLINLVYFISYLTY